MGTASEEIRQIKNDFHKLAEASGNLQKQNIIRSMRHTASGRALKLYLNPDIVFHLDQKSFQKEVDLLPDTSFVSLFDLAGTFSAKSGITHQDLANIHNFIRSIDPDVQEFCRAYLQKSIRLGASVSTYNKCFPDEPIKTVSCMLAYKYLERPHVVEGKEFVLTPKLDGERCICLKRGNDIRFYTRQGKLIDGMEHIAAEIALVPDDRMFDGELLVKHGFDMKSSDAFKKTMQIVRKNGKKFGIDYHVFDTMTASEYDTQNSRIYNLRREELNKLEVHHFLRSQHVKVVHTMYRGSDVSMIMETNNLMRDNDQEGVMINIIDQPYFFKRTAALLKVKTFNDIDLRIVDLIEGDGRNTGTLGALLVDYKGSLVGVGSGFSDEQRQWFWDNKEQTVGRVARISYFEETTDKNGVPSLRFPVFVSLCDEGKGVSYN